MINDYFALFIISFTVLFFVFIAILFNSANPDYEYNLDEDIENKDRYENR